jgi:hypothetical protein
LSGYKYDSLATKQLNLTPDVDGAAFRKKTDNTMIYCLWAKTKIDNSEQTSAVYSFPDLLAMKQIQRMDWQFSTTAEVKIIDSKLIPLTGAPTFYKKYQIGTGKIQMKK